MITLELDVSGLEQALAEMPRRLDVRLPQGLDATCEEIAARARQTTTYTDRTGLLRQSTQNAGVTGSARGELVGVVSFAARSRDGYLYGLAQEFGTHAGRRERTAKQIKRESGARFKGPRQRNGIKAKRFIRDAVDAQDGALLESALGAAFRDAGFEVR